MRVHPFDEWPKHLHRATDEVIAGLTGEEERLLRLAGYPGGVVAHDTDTEAIARKHGYGDEYLQGGIPEGTPAPVAEGDES